MQTTKQTEEFLKVAYESTSKMNDAMRVLSSRDTVKVQQLAVSWGLKLDDQQVTEILSSYEDMASSKDPRPSFS